jgi:hypothetical protein
VCLLDRRQERVFGRPFGIQILQQASDIRARHIEQPLQREVLRKVVFVQRPARAGSGLMMG